MASGEGGKECRICFEAGPGLIAPCKCTGSSKWIHRQCLDQWRCTGPDPAFERCNTCLFPYRHTRKPTNGLTPHQKYKLMVYRDVASVILLLLLAIAAVGLVMYGLDLPKGNVPILMRGIGISSDAGAYTLFGVVMFFAFVGFCACTVKCCMACCAGGGGGGGNDMLFGYYYCYWWDGPCYVNHYHGATTTSTDCCGNPTSQRNSCDCDGQECGCDGCSGDCGGDCGGDNPLAVLLVVVVVIFALVGMFYVAFMLSVVFADVSRRHAHILHKRAEASSQVVLDLDGKDLDNLGELGDMADGELQDDDSRSPLLANSSPAAKYSSSSVGFGPPSGNMEPVASAPPWSLQDAEAVPWEEDVATKEQPWSPGKPL